MMNDRFDAQLRQHLLDTANEHPVDGQLAEILDLVAANGQQRGIAARLTWVPARIGPILSPAFRYGLAALALIVAGIAVALLAGREEPPPSTVFEGTWTTIDPADGSTMFLVVGPGTEPTVHFEDRHATGAACVDDEVKVYTADGTGEIADGHMDAAFPDGGGCGSRRVPFAGTYDHRAGSDTLLDAEGLVWAHVPSGDSSDPAPQDSPEPVTDPPTSDGPIAVDPTAPPPTFPAFAVDPSYTCDLLDGTYGGWFGDIRVDAITPTTWHGLDDVFHAEDDGCGGGGAVRIEITVVSEVYPDPCSWQGRGIDVGAPDAASSAFSDASLFAVNGPTNTELGSFPAWRYELTVPTERDRSACSEGKLQLWRDPAREEAFGPTTFNPGSLDVYFVEVGDVTLGVYAYKGEGWATPAQVQELDAVVESLRFEIETR